MSRQKKQGTTHESWIVNELAAREYPARRIAEGGSNDEGDIEATFAGEKWVLEGKARSNLNVQQALGKARAKARAANGGVPVPVAVVWKRLVRVPGLQVRQPVEGERVVVVLGWDDYVSLVDKATKGANSGRTE
jgi:hypothetical protein